MKDVVEVIARALVDNPNSVDVKMIEKENNMVLLELRVGSEDMGKVIGKQGKIARAIRLLVKAAATKQGKKAILEIV